MTENHRSSLSDEEWGEMLCSAPADMQENVNTSFSYLEDRAALEWLHDQAAMLTEATWDVLNPKRAAKRDK